MLYGVSVGRVIDAVCYLDGAEIKRIDSLQAPDIVAVQTWVTAALVMRIYAAN